MMFAHTPLQIDARSQSGPTSQRHERVRRLASILVSAFMLALLAFLGTSLGHTASAHSSVRAAPCDADTNCLEQSMFNLINSERAAAGLPLYTWSDILANTARDHSNQMASGCGQAHQCPGEDLPYQRIYAAWGPVAGTWFAGENIHDRPPAPTYDDAIVQMHQDFMAEGPGGGHYDNIMSTKFQYVGVGIVIDAAGVAWLTEDFFGNS